MKLVYVFLVQLVCTVFVVLGAGGGIESYVPNAYPQQGSGYPQYGSGGYYPYYYNPHPYQMPYGGAGYYRGYMQQYGYGNFNRGGGLGILGTAGLLLFGFFAMMFMLFFFIMMWAMISGGGLFGGGSDTSDLLLASALND